MKKMLFSTLFFCFWSLTVFSQFPQITDEAIQKQIDANCELNSHITDLDSIIPGDIYFHTALDSTVGRWKIIQQGENIWRITKEFLNRDYVESYNMEATLATQNSVAEIETISRNLQSFFLGTNSVVENLEVIDLSKQYSDVAYLAAKVEVEIYQKITIALIFVIISLSSFFLLKNK